jgi:membrane protease YdiL (CAAX protease family)
MTPTPLALLPFLLLLVAVLGLWVHRTVWVGAFALAVGVATFTGAITGLAGLWIAILAALAYGYRSARDAPRTPAMRATQIVAGLAFFLFALAMSLLLLPGFPRTTLIADAVLSPGAVPYGIGLGFPKVAAGILVLGIIRDDRVRSWRELARVLMLAMPVFAATTGAVMMFALATGFVAFDPKWTPVFLVWMVTNLFFTCLAEEAFFRGFVLAELARVGGRAWMTIAVVVSAILFGLAHFGGGPTYVIAGVIAGLGYGLAYLRTRRVEAAMAVHFGVNAVHFLFFTYPRFA